MPPDASGRMMMENTPLREEKKPLAGTCHHQWQDRESPYAVVQLCAICMLFRYKTSVTADWEYRAPIPFGQVPRE